MTDTKDYSFDLYVARKMQGKAHNARDRGIEFNLSFAAMRNLLRSKKCYYTGIALTRPESGSTTLKASDLTIDRIDSSKGYVHGNVVACCHAANQMKSFAEGAGIAGLKAAEKIFSKSIKRIEESK